MYLILFLLISLILMPFVTSSKNDEALINHGDLTSSPVEFVPDVVQFLSVLLDRLLLLCC